MSVWSSTHPTNARFFRVVGAAFFDYTAEAADDTPNDIFFGSQASPSTGDYFAIGWSEPFINAVLTVSTAYDGVSGFVWEYWNGGGWTPLVGVVDGTAGFTFVGAGTVSWELPEDWAQNTVDGVLAYHVRALWSPWTSTVTAPRGTIISITGVETDPVYGSNPLDPETRWEETILPPMSGDPEWTAIRNVTAEVQEEANASQWLTRWRRSIMTAVGYQLDQRGQELGYIRPAGWDDVYYQGVLVALIPGIFGRATPPVVTALCDALAVAPQSYEIEEPSPLTGLFSWYDTSEDQALSISAALERIRPPGIQYILVYSPVPAGDTFLLDSSLLDGPDGLAAII